MKFFELMQDLGYIEDADDALEAVCIGVFVVVTVLLVILRGAGVL